MKTKKGMRYRETDKYESECCPDDEKKPKLVESSFYLRMGIKAMGEEMKIFNEFAKDYRYRNV